MVLSPPEGNTNQEPSPPPEIDYFGKGTASQPPVTRDLAGTKSKSDDGDPPPQFDLDEEDPPRFDSDGSDSDEPPPSNCERASCYARANLPRTVPKSYWS